MSTTNSNLGNVASGSAAGLGGGASYDPATGTWTAPAYTVNSADGSAPTVVNNVGDALTGIYNQGTKYFHTNSTLPDSVASGANAVAIGPQAVASGASAVAMGLGAQATGTNAIAIGSGALATGSQAIGANSRAGGGGAAFGDNADAGGTPLSAAPAISKGTAIGFGAVVQQTGGVALGAGSVANRPGGTIVEAVSGTTVTNTQAAVSVGSVGAERQITNVAGGTQATDAVNVRQLQAVSAGGIRYETNPDGTTNYNQVTLGDGQAPGGTRVSNVAPGILSSDAVNVGQLRQVQAGVGEVARLAYSGTAMAMAMSGTYLPTLYPGEKTVGVGVGSYKGYGAIAVTFKQLSDDGRMSWGAGVSTTGKDWGINAGIGWKWK